MSFRSGMGRLAPGDPRQSIMRQISEISTPLARSEDRTDWWPIFRELRDAREALGLKAHHLNTLAALLSFLKAGDDRMMVYASNRSILERLNGASERTLQRHIVDLEAVGLLRRADSPNRKRYRLRGRGGDMLIFGFDLAPLRRRASEFAAMADQMREERAEQALVRQRILLELDRLRCQEAPLPDEREIRLVLRRRANLTLLKKIQADVCQQQCATPELEDVSDLIEPPAANLSASAARDVAHYQMSKPKVAESKCGASIRRVEPLEKEALGDLVARTCGEALTWLRDGDRIHSWSEIVRKSQTLASWIGIAPPVYQSAERAVGSERAAATVLWIIQSGERIIQPPAYFRSVTTGNRAASFRLESVLNRLAS